MNLDVNRVLDERNWSTYQKFLIVCVALTIILDGIDNSMLGISLPELPKDWAKHFPTALAMSPFGMLFGGLLGGWLGDRIGRRTALVASVLLFAVPTALIYFVPDVMTLCICRFLAGLGLGGAMPTATALASEYVPKRQRPFAVTLTIVCVPLGAMFAAKLSSFIIPQATWRGFFLIGGFVPFLIGVALFFVLPESPRYLANRPSRREELARLLRKMGINVPADATFSGHERVAAPAGRDDKGLESSASPASPLAQMFSPGMRGDVLCLFGSFFFGLLVAYLVLQLWVQALTTKAGFSATDAREVLFWWNVGGVIGAIIGALVIQRLGSRAPMVTLCVLAVAASLGLAALPLQRAPAGGAVAATTPSVATGPAETTAVVPAPATVSAPVPAVAQAAATTKVPTVSLTSNLGIAVIVLSILMGIATNGVQVAMYALAAHVYPTQIRATGLGVAVAVGRIGNILASYVGAFVLTFGIAYYFATAAFAMGAVMLFLLFIRRHIERYAADSKQSGFPVEVEATSQKA